MSRPADASRVGNADAASATPRPRRAPSGGRAEPGTPAAGTPVVGAPAPAGGPLPAAPGPAAGPPSPRIPPTTSSGPGVPAYTVANRFADWRRARADGRAGIPGTGSGTPALEELAQEFLSRSHRERLRLDVELAPLLETEAALVVRIGATEAAAQRAEQRAESWPVLLDDGQLGLRRGGESQTPDDIVRARRAREYEALRRPMVDEIARLTAAATAAREELARVRAALRAREVVGATRVRRLHAQTMRRISAYERHLVRFHPQRDRIGPTLAAQHPRIPGWVFAAEDPTVPPAAHSGAGPTPPAGTPDPTGHHGRVREES